MPGLLLPAAVAIERNAQSAAPVQRGPSCGCRPAEMGDELSLAPSLAALGPYSVRTGADQQNVSMVHWWSCRAQHALGPADKRPASAELRACHDCQRRLVLNTHTHTHTRARARTHARHYELVHAESVHTLQQRCAGQLVHSRQLRQAWPRPALAIHRLRRGHLQQLVQRKHLRGCDSERAIERQRAYCTGRTSLCSWEYCRRGSSSSSASRCAVNGGPPVKRASAACSLASAASGASPPISRRPGPICGSSCEPHLQARKVCSCAHVVCGVCFIVTHDSVQLVGEQRAQVRPVIPACAACVSCLRTAAHPAPSSPHMPHLTWPKTAISAIRPLRGGVRRRSAWLSLAKASKSSREATRSLIGASEATAGLSSRDTRPQSRAAHARLCSQAFALLQPCSSAVPAEWQPALPV